jgi:hypothetical protein
MPTPIAAAPVPPKPPQPKESPSAKVQDSKFDGVMANKTQVAQSAAQIQQVGQVAAAQKVSSAQKILETTRIEKSRLDRAKATLTRGAVESNGGTEGASTMMKLVTDLEHGQANVDKMIQMAIGGFGKHKLDFQQLTILQMQVYQYSQQMDLTSKVVDKATNGLKDTLKTQV